MRILGYEPAVIVYAVNAAVAALVAWGLDLTADQISTSVTAGSIVLALLLRQNVSPAPAASKAMTQG